MECSEEIKVDFSHEGRIKETENREAMILAFLPSLEFIASKV